MSIPNVQVGDVLNLPHIGLGRVIRVDAEAVFVQLGSGNLRRLPMSVLPFVLGSEDDTGRRLGDLFDYANRDSPPERIEVPIGLVTAALAQMASDCPSGKGKESTSAYTHWLASYDARHLGIEHGRARESMRGQVPIGRADSEFLPVLLQQPDELWWAGKTSSGLDALVTQTRINGILYVVE